MYRLEFNREYRELLEELAYTEDTSMVEIFRRAIMDYAKKHWTEDEIYFIMSTYFHKRHTEGV